MRNFVQFEANHRLQCGVWGLLRRILANRKQRGDLRRLQTMDDRILRDMGLTRKDIDSLIRLPYSTDLRWEVDRLRRISAIPSRQN
jgi:uncharacterized protein YjiS (DUF1127 family)